MFIGRQSELAELEKRWQSGTFEFGVVYGTRRIGKTTLLQEFVKIKTLSIFRPGKRMRKIILRLSAVNSGKAEAWTSTCSMIPLIQPLTVLRNTLQSSE